jgi:hypothetical protein
MNKRQKKYPKYSENWINEVKTMSLILDKGETDETKKKSKFTEKSLEERKELATEKITLTAKLAKADEYEDLANKESKRVIEEKPKWDNFTGNGATGTVWDNGDGGNSGWNSYTTATLNNNAGYSDNLYGCKVPTTTPGTTTDIKITEEEAIALTSKVIKVLERVSGVNNGGDFDTKATARGTHAITAGNAIAYLTTIQLQAKEMAANKSYGRDGYDLPYTYQGFDETQSEGKKSLDTNRVSNQVNLTQFFQLIDWMGDETFLDSLDNSNIKQNEVWNIYPYGDQYSQDELKSFVGNVGTNVKYYKTGYKGKTLQNPTVFSIGNGKVLKEWIKLVKTTFPAGSTQRTKLINSLTPTNNTQAKMLRETWTNAFNTNYTIDAINSITSDTRKNILIQQAASLRLEVDKKKDEIDDKITAKETEVTAIIAEIVKEKRAVLKTYNLDKGFEKKTVNNATEDNRKTKSDLELIITLLEDIRFLEKDDTNEDSTEVKENTAYTAITEILDNKVNLTTATTEDETKDIYLVNIYEGYNKSDSEALTEFEKQTTATGKTLTDLWNGYNQLENFIKLSGKQEASRSAIKDKIDGKDQPENWREKLKNLDPLLETALTEEIINKWKGQTEGNKHFATLANVETLVKKVVDSSKKTTKTDFLAVLKKIDPEITDIGKLFTKKEPKEVIKIILKYEYDQLTDGTETDDEKKAKTQQERKIKKVLGKSASDTLTEAEISQTLYEVAIGEKTLSSKSLKADLSEYKDTEEDNEDNQQQPNKKWYQPYYWPLWVAGGVIVAGAVIFYFFAQKKKETTKSEEELEKEE